MSDAKKPTDKVRDTINEHIVDPAKKAGERLKETGQTLAEGGSTIGLKMIEQAEANTREAFAAMRAAAQAKDLTEVMRVQGDYMREQGNRSLAQAREIGDLIMSFGRSAVAPLRGGKKD